MTTDTDTCTTSLADLGGAEGDDCAADKDGCGTGLVCALDIADSAGANQMSICIPPASC